MKRFASRKVLFLLSLLAIFLWSIILTYPPGAAGTQTTPSVTAVAHLPIIQYDASPTPVPTPPLPNAIEQAKLEITPSGGLNASTFNSNSFILHNLSTSTTRINEVRIDLSTAVFPDMIFDPFGQGGDTVAKDVKVDYSGKVGFSGHSYEGEHGGGFDVLILQFNFFDPGKQFRFSVDVDPNSIKGVGAPGPHESGSVSGIELIGSTITVTFDNGVVLTQQMYRIPGSDSGSELILRNGLPQRPIVAVKGVSNPPSVVQEVGQVVQVSGPSWHPVTLLVLEGGLFLEGVPGGGYNVKPFDANSVVAIREYRANTGFNGTVEIPIVLSRSNPTAGINHLVGALAFHDLYGDSSIPIVLELQN